MSATRGFVSVCRQAYCRVSNLSKPPSRTSNCFLLTTLTSISPHILVVDDDPDLRELLGSYLGADMLRGYECDPFDRSIDNRVTRLRRKIEQDLAATAYICTMRGEGYLFNAMAQQVRDLLTTRTALLAGISHDLRTPLARMLLALEMLKVSPDPKLIERLERDIDQMTA